MKTVIAGLSIYLFSTLAFADTGTVLWFSDSKGFGVIQRDDGAKFNFHFQAINAGGFKSVKENARVCFSIGQPDKRGWVVRNIQACG